MPYTTTEPKIYYEVKGHGPAIVWSHGLLMDFEMFSQQVEEFSQDYTCISWDERAHGKTAVDDSTPFTYYDSAADLMRILDDLGFESAILAGMSQGGYLSLRAALKYPQRVRGLILIATQAQCDSAIPEEYICKYQTFHNSLKEDHFNEESLKFLRSVIMNPSWGGTEYWAAKWRKLKMQNVRAAFACLGNRDDIQPMLCSIKVPCLAIHGTDDQAIPLASSRLMSSALPDCKFHEVQGENHAPNMSSPEEVNKLIRDFLLQKFSKLSGNQASEICSG